MTKPPYRNTLIAAGIAATLGFGAAGCSETADPSSKQEAASQRSSDSAITSGVKETGDSATQAVTDTWITTKVKSVLLADSEAKGLDVEVNTKDGVVTLKGKLTNQAAADHVKALVMDVEGVKRVNTQALTIASR